MVDKIKYIVNILIVALLLASVAIQRDGRVAGVDVIEALQDNNGRDEETEPIETTLSDGTKVINSLTLGKDIIGFGGRTPVKVYVKEQIIQKVEADAGSETPSFFDEVIRSGLLGRWDGLTLEEAARLEVDVVSGATYSSHAIIENVKRASQYGADIAEENTSGLSNLGGKDVAGLVVIALGVLITLLKSRSKPLIILQMVLNVVVLGFWCGSFLSLSTFTSWISSGINLQLSLVTFAMLCATIAMPLFGKKGSYCHIHCPMGSAQELIGRLPVTKAKITPKVSKVLNSLRYYLLAILLFMMWLGVGFDLMNYEIFSAFIITSASTAVLVMAALFLVLSLFIQRPYCRFICPTGALITMSQKTR